MSKELLFSVTKKDLEITHFTGSGAGGQNRNKNATACRIKHKDSGAVVECQKHKSYEQNKKEAFKKLPEHPKFKVWYAKVLYEFRNKKSIEQVVAEQIVDEKLKIEYRINDRWTEVQ
jgi:protein subunit release factor B